jgi:protease II
MSLKNSLRIANKEPDCALFLSGILKFDMTTVHFSWKSILTPQSVYDYDLATRRRPCSSAGGAGWL